jgi:hypothetical protein
MDNLNAVDIQYLNLDYCESILKKIVRDIVVRITQIQDVSRSASRVPAFRRPFLYQAGDDNFGLSNFNEQSPSRETRLKRSRPRTQEIHSMHHRVHKSPSPVPVSS